MSRFKPELRSRFELLLPPCQWERHVNQVFVRSTNWPISAVMQPLGDSANPEADDRVAR